MSDPSRIVTMSDGMALVDTNGAVLVDSMESVVVATDQDEVTYALELAGRVNRTDDRAIALYLLKEDSVTELVTLLVMSLRDIDRHKAERCIDVARRALRSA